LTAEVNSLKGDEISSDISLSSTVKSSNSHEAAKSLEEEEEDGGCLRNESDDENRDKSKFVD
jgi:hypothetical protein